MPRKGKYAAIIDKLPRTLGTEPEYQTKVNAVKMAILDPAPEELKDSEEAVLDNINNSLAIAVRAIGDLNNSLLDLPLGRRHGSKFAAAWRQARRIKEEIEEQLSELGITMEAYNQLIVDQYEVEGVTSLKLEDGSSVSVQYEPKVQVLDRERFRLWCIENGLEQSLQLPWQTANALTKERLLEGQAEPDGTQAFAATKLVLRK